MEKVRVRIAPSPTGEDLHIGNVYTALINFVFAKQKGGRFIVRIEDTDRKRFIPGSEERILSSLRWLNLEFDEGPDIGGPYGPYRQSERLDLYKYYAEKLVEKGYAYYCYCSREDIEKMRKKQQEKGLPPMYDGRCRGRRKKIKNKKGVVRLKVPKTGETSFNDIIRGKISFKNKTIDDQVLLKSDGFPTYHLAVVVDDYAMKISHIIRAEEWISSTPKHILLYKALGWKIPFFAHLPLLRNKDRSKLSKRRNPVWVSWYRRQGFLPEAILNYLALMGWGMPASAKELKAGKPEEQEIFSMEEFIKKFSLERVATTGPVFDLEKLEWLNGEYIRAKSDNELTNLIYQYINILIRDKDKDYLVKIIPLIKTRIKKLSDFESMAGFFFERPKDYERKIDKKWLKMASEALEKETNWQSKRLYNLVRDLAEDLKISKNKLFMEIRIAVTGKKIGPPLFESMEILGKKETIKRLKQVI